MQKGFTLIELLIVIAILGILTAAVVVVLNPAQLLAQARDSQRFSDLSSVQSAINFYLSTTTSTTPLITTTTVMVSTTTNQFVQANSVVNASTTVGVNGWVPAALYNSTGGVSPLAALPVDPVNNASFYYAYCGIAGNSTYEVNASLESTKYVGREALDGGDEEAFYEVGTNLTC